MRRRLVKLVVFLLLGATVNVAVAWGCALWSKIPVRLSNGLAPSQLKYPPFTGTGFLDRTIFEQWDSGFGLRSYERIATSPLVYIRMVSSGIPLRSLNGSIANNNYLLGAIEAPEWIDPPSAWSLTRRLIPLVPIWPDFAINTVFYAVILWLLFAAPFALRRRRRIRRGLCPACAYPVGDGDVCTECGKTVVKQKAQTQKAEMT